MGRQTRLLHGSSDTPLACFYLRRWCGCRGPGQGQRNEQRV